MGDLEHIQALMKELVTFPEFVGVRQHDVESWSVFLAAEQEVFVDYLHDNEQIVIVGQLPLVELPQPSDLFRSMLNFNQVQKSEHSSHVTLSADGKLLSVIMTLACQELCLQDFKVALLHFQQQFQGWQQVVRDPTCVYSLTSESKPVSATRAAKSTLALR